MLPKRLTPCSIGCSCGRPSNPSSGRRFAHVNSHFSHSLSYLPLKISELSCQCVFPLSKLSIIHASGRLISMADVAPDIQIEFIFPDLFSPNEIRVFSNCRTPSKSVNDARDILVAQTIQPAI